MKLAEGSTKEESTELQNALPEKGLPTEKIKETQAVIDMGLYQKRCIKNKIREISQKKIKLSKR